MRRLNLIRWLLVLLMLSTPGLALAQDGPETVRLVPFENAAAGISGLAPEGWQQIQTGLFMAGTLGPNLVFQFAQAQSAEGVAPALAAQFGLEEVPQGTPHASPTLTWTLYHLRVTPQPDLPLEIDLAVTPAGEDSLVIMLQALPEDYAGLYDSVFIPAVDALVYTPPPAGPDTIALEPFSDPTFGLSGVRPAGWRETGSGEVRRERTPTDVTSLIQQVATGARAASVAPILAERLGTGEAPEPLGTLTTPPLAEDAAETLTWTFYTFPVNVGGATASLSLAAADSASGAVLVMLVSTPEEHAALYDALFLPAVRELRLVAGLWAVTLVEYQSAALGLRGVAPEGWTEAQAGYFVPEQPGAALTYDVLPGQTAAAAVAALTGRLGLSDPPGRDGVFEGTGFTWDVYSFTLTVQGVTMALDLAAAQDDQGAVVVLLQSSPGVRTALAQALFLPAVQALARSTS